MKIKSNPCRAFWHLNAGLTATRPRKSPHSFAYQLGTLEPRVLLASTPVSLTVGGPLQSTEYSNAPINVAVKQSVVFDAKITYPVGGPVPQGEVIIANDQETFAHTTSGSAVVTSYSFPSAGVAIATASIELTQYTSSSTYNFVYAYFIDDANYSSTVSVSTDSDSNPVESGSYVPFSYASSVTPDRLVFHQNPQNTAAGDTLSPPVTAELLSAEGTVDTSAANPVMLTLNDSGETGSSVKLGGTTTETAAEGLATFSNLTVDTPGTYYLSASADGLTTVASSTFDVTGGKLVFSTPFPRQGSAGEPLSPVIKVRLENGKNQLLSDDSSTVVTLTPVGVTAGSPITGDTATLQGGVATFSNVVLGKPGFYQLQASDGGDTTATSGKIKITGDHLKFEVQPKNADVDAPLTIKVVVENAKGQLDTLDSTDAVQLSLNSIKSNGNAALTGTTLLTFAAGVASFTPAAMLAVSQPGTFTLTATEVDGAMVAVAGTASVTSNQFGVGPYHLVITDQPKDADVNSPVEFTVKAEDAKGKVDTDLNTGFARIIFTQISSEMYVVPLFPFTNGGFFEGVDTFTGSGAPVIHGYGHFHLQADALDSTGKASLPDVYPSALSRPFQIYRNRLVFTEQPHSTTVGGALNFEVQIVDKQGQPIENDFSIFGVYKFGVGPTSPGVLPDTNDGAGIFMGATCDFTNKAAPSTPGKYEVTVAGSFADVSPQFLPVTSRPFTVLPAVSNSRSLNVATRHIRKTLTTTDTDTAFSLVEATNISSTANQG